MITLKKIRKKLAKLIPGNPSEITKGRWVYKLTVEDVSLIFDVADLSCFGFRKRKKHREFLAEYNNLFNPGSNDKQINIDRYRLKLQTKLMKLRAMYEALATSEAENSKAEFELMFGRRFSEVEDLKILTNESERIAHKIKTLLIPQKDNGISFSQLVVIVETSRGIAISQKTKLFRFYEMYKLELEKWHKT